VGLCLPCTCCFTHSVAVAPAPAATNPHTCDVKLCTQQQLPCLHNHNHRYLTRTLTSHLPLLCFAIPPRLLAATTTGTLPGTCPALTSMPAASAASCPRPSATSPSTSAVAPSCRCRQPQPSSPATCAPLLSLWSSRSRLRLVPVPWASQGPCRLMFTRRRVRMPTPGTGGSWCRVGMCLWTPLGKT
jgi:hypothetical protein